MFEWGAIRKTSLFADGQRLDKGTKGCIGRFYEFKED